MAPEPDPVNGVRPDPTRWLGRATQPGYPPWGHSQMHPQRYASSAQAPRWQMSDVSQDFLSESDMKKELTEYAVFRFDMVRDKEAFDDNGQRKWPNWEKVWRVEESSISKRDAAEKIRHLNRTTRKVHDKKNSFSVALARQLDLTLEHLMARDPDLTNFYWKLAQITGSVKPLLDPYANNAPFQQCLYCNSRHGKKSTSCHSSKKRHSRSRHGGKNKKPKGGWPYCSLIAYFERVPQSNADIALLWQQTRRVPRGTYRPYADNVQNGFPHEQQVRNQFQAQPQTNAPHPHRASGAVPPQNSAHPQEGAQNAHMPKRAGEGVQRSRSNSGSESAGSRSSRRPRHNERSPPPSVPQHSRRPSATVPQATPQPQSRGKDASYRRGFRDAQRAHRCGRDDFPCFSPNFSRHDCYDDHCHCDHHDDYDNAPRSPRSPRSRRSRRRGDDARRPQQDESILEDEIFSSSSPPSSYRYTTDSSPRRRRHW
ncbi:hypothetical protein GGS21DRAFT_481753 [Xylaria nigripes]|nr:hypothetical protein GGS21DRAFT_481753 [Xylaria nigripes]